jgi:hypothetical protein
MEPATQDSRERASRVGVDLFLRKPIPSQTILDTLQQFAMLRNGAEPSTMRSNEGAAFK